MADDVDTSIRYFEDELNDIRRNVERIRTWGQEWKDEALYLSKQLKARDAPKEIEYGGTRRILSLRSLSKPPMGQSQRSIER